MNVLFVGFAIPGAALDRLLTTDRGMPVQTQKFGWAVIQALRSAGIDVTVLSAEPASDYPYNSRILFRSRTFTERGVSGRSVSFINLMGLKHLTRYVGVSRRARAGLSNPPDAVVVHGVHSPFIWSAVALGRRLGIPVAVILTDPPSLKTSLDPHGAALLKRLDRRLILKGLSRVTGVIALSEQLARDFAPGKPCLVMEGIANAPSPSSARRPGDHIEATTRGSRPRVVYAGTLRPEYGVSELMRAVEASDGDWVLDIYGRGPAQVAVERAAAGHQRINFGGFASDDQLAAIYNRAALLVNPRPPSADFTHHSFPSKLLEYVASGRPVLSTRLPTIPVDYEPLMYWSKPDAVSLAAAIDQVLELDATDVARRAAGSAACILAAKGSAAQGLRMRDFLTELARRV